jgi:hypothetical protein
MNTLSCRQSIASLTTVGEVGMDQLAKKNVIDLGIYHPLRRRAP